MRRAMTTVIAIVLLSATTASAQQQTPPTSKRAPLVIAGIWSGIVLGDVLSDRYATTRANTSEANPLLPGDAQSRYMTEGVTAFAGWYATTYLWQTDHKRIATAVMVGNILLRGWVIRHNIGLVR